MNLIYYITNGFHSSIFKINCTPDEHKLVLKWPFYRKFTNSKWLCWVTLTSAYWLVLCRTDHTVHFTSRMETQGTGAQVCTKSPHLGATSTALSVLLWSKFCSLSLCSFPQAQLYYAFLGMFPSSHFHASSFPINFYSLLSGHCFLLLQYYYFTPSLVVS